MEIQRTECLLLRKMYNRKKVLHRLQVFLVKRINQNNISKKKKIQVNFLLLTLGIKMTRGPHLILSHRSVLKKSWKMKQNYQLKMKNNLSKLRKKNKTKLVFKILIFLMIIIIMIMLIVKLVRDNIKNLKLLL